MSLFKNLNKLIIKEKIWVSILGEVYFYLLPANVLYYFEFSSYNCLSINLLFKLNI